MQKEFDIVVFGMGYVGLPTAALLADSGSRVLGLDIDQELVEKLRSGELEVHEPDLKEKVRSATETGHLTFSTRLSTASVYVICVPTPLMFVKGEPRPDTRPIESVIRAVGPVLESDDLVILESTSPPGTLQAVVDQIRDAGYSASGVHFAYCPERVLPGNMINELRTNPRIIGGYSEEAAHRAKTLYERFSTGECRLTDSLTAEIAKLVENSYRDVSVAFANEVSMIASSFAVNDRELISLVNMHPRVNVLAPSVGVGGHCIAVDPWFLVDARPSVAKLIRTAREVNDGKGEWIVGIIEERLREKFGLSAEKYGSAKILILGLTYKPDSQDLRESRALYVLRELQSRGFQMWAVEPHRDAIENVDLVPLSADLEGYDLVVALVAHTAFRSVDFAAASGVMFLDFAGIGSNGTPAQGRPRRL